MKTKYIIQLAATALLVSTLNSQFSICLGQGALTPPGAPAPTMKSLDQIEPRAPISFLPFAITSSGSYYLTTNLVGVVNQNGISISADNVTIDLNGFTLFGGGGGSGEAIWSPAAQQNLIVRNGTVRNWPGSGINFYDAGSSQAVIENIQSISNGFTGIAVKNGSRVVNCVVAGNSLRGILVDNDCLVEHCKAAGSTLFGIGAGSGCHLLNNQSTGNGTGLNITGTNNIVSDNIVRLNTANYSVAQGNQLDILLCQVPETINWPAKVKLVGSMNVASGDAITIKANFVTLDLNGFTISSTQNPPGSAGILLGSGSGPVTNVTILNGFISGGIVNNAGTYSGKGFYYGITPYNPSLGAPVNARVSGVSVSACLFDGIYLGDDSIVESCTIKTVGGSGIVAGIVSDSKVRECGSVGISATTADNCYVWGSTTNAIQAATAVNCYGYSSGNGDGIHATTANNCNGIAGGNGTGVFAAAATGCYGKSSGGIGLFAPTAAFCFGERSGGTAISAVVANGCFNILGTNTISYKYNMP